MGDAKICKKKKKKKLVHISKQTLLCIQGIVTEHLLCSGTVPHPELLVYVRFMKVKS